MHLTGTLVHHKEVVSNISLRTASADPVVPMSSPNVTQMQAPGVDINTPAYIITWVTLVNVILFVIGVTGNAMVTIIVIRIKTMRVPNNFFFASLSIADLLVLVICQPSALLEFYAKDRWYLGSVMCEYKVNQSLGHPI